MPKHTRFPNQDFPSPPPGGLFFAPAQAAGPCSESFCHLAGVSRASFPLGWRGGEKAHPMANANTFQAGLWAQLLPPSLTSHNTPRLQALLGTGFLIPCVTEKDHANHHRSCAPAHTRQRA